MKTRNILSRRLTLLPAFTLMLLASGVAFAEGVSEVVKHYEVNSQAFCTTPI